MDELVKIVECPRDAWQGLPAHDSGRDEGRTICAC